MLAWQNIRKGWGLLTHEERTRWALLIPLGMLSALLEAAATAAVFALAALIAGAGDVRAVAVFDRLRAYLPDLEDNTLLIIFLVFTTLLFLIKAALTFLTVVYNNKIAARDQARFATSMFRGYLRLPFVLHLGRHSADYVHQVRQSVETVFGLLIWHMLNLARTLMSIVGLVLVLLLANPWATSVLALAVSAWLVLLTVGFRAYYLRLGHDADDLKRQRERTLQEGLGALQEIQMLGRESYFADRFEALEHGLIETRFKDSSAATLPRILNELVFVLVMIGVVAWVGRGPGQLASLLPLLGLYAYAGVRLLPAGNGMVDSINQINGATHPLAQLLHDRELIRLYALTNDSSGNGQELVFHRRIELRAVTYRFPEATRNALEDVSITIEHGTCVAIVGSTGSGKTTLMSLLAGVLTPTTGELLIDGQPIESPRAWQRNIGYVAQTPFLVADTVRRNVALGVEDRHIDTARVDVAVRLAGLEDVIAQLPAGVDTHIGQQGRKLSGGQRQRVAIARALYSDPGLLLFDEAMSALDAETEQEVLDVIARLRGLKTIVVISHRLQSARAADNIILLEQGRVGASGPWDELRDRNERFRRLIGQL